MEEIEIIIKVFLLSWFWMNFSPLKWIYAKWMQPTLKRFKSLKFIDDTLTCMNCMAFWIALGISLSIYVAIASALLCHIYQIIMKKYFSTRIYKKEYD